MALMKRLDLALFLSASVLLLDGCGDAQLDYLVRGKPIHRFEGFTQSAGKLSWGSLRMAMFWNPNGPSERDPEKWVEQVGTSTPIDPALNWVMNVFETPGPEHMMRLSDGSPASYAVGRIMVYSDATGNGRREPGEPFAGISGFFGFYYFREHSPAGQNPTNGAMEPGFYTVLLPQPCGYQPPAATDAGTCGVELGRTCNMDSNCSPGICILDAPMPWPSGYCTTLDPSPRGCYPSTGVYLGLPSRVRPGDTGPPMRKGIYLKPCSDDTQCRRSDELQQNSYRCDPGLRGCTPGPPPSIQLADAVRIDAFCTVDAR